MAADPPRRPPSGGNYQVNISQPFIERPIATSLLMAAMAFVGLVAFPFLPVAPLPQVDFPTIQVNATCRAPAPRPWRLRSRRRWSANSGRFPASTQLTSVSALDSTSITIQFDLNRNIDSAAQDVQAAITVAGRQLPQQMSIAAELQEGQSGRFARS